MAERDVRHAIRVALGREKDLTLWNNPVGRATYQSRHGQAKVPYGLARGASDLVGILAPTGRWVAIEVKAPGSRTDPKRAELQRLWADLIRSRGGFAAQVDSVEAAVAALDRARAGLSE